jgi:putative transposase
MLRIAAEDNTRQEFTLALDEICRRGSERMLAAALEAEVDSYLERHQGDRDDRGRSLVVRNSRARPRQVVTGAGDLHRGENWAHLLSTHTHEQQPRPA